MKYIGSKARFTRQLLPIILKNKMQGVQFSNVSFDKVDAPPRSIVYCDHPYESTTGYKTGAAFDHSYFWDRCRLKSEEGHSVFISEYNAPEDFMCIWEKEVKSQFPAGGKNRGICEPLLL